MGSFTNVSRALQNNLAKIQITFINHIYGENFKLEFCTLTQIMSCRMFGTTSFSELQNCMRMSLAKYQPSFSCLQRQNLIIYEAYVFCLLCDISMYYSLGFIANPQALRQTHWLRHSTRIWCIPLHSISLYYINHWTSMITEMVCINPVSIEFNFLNIIQRVRLVPYSYFS